MQRYVWCKKGPSYKHENIIPNASWPGQFIVMNGKLNSQVYPGIVQDNVRFLFIELIIVLSQTYHAMNVMSLSIHLHICQCCV
uniref:Uncharacterized protein n=1 Tax=Seriola lalandi dorsalis TaxID=1841481 RepID=A0A3B4X7Z5_SERLL